MDQETYDENLAKIKAGKIVTWNGRRASTIEQLDAIARIENVDIKTAGDAVMEGRYQQVCDDNADLRAKVSELQAENASLAAKNVEMATHVDALEKAAAKQLQSD
jgi:hypothetical protein